MPSDRTTGELSVSITASASTSATIAFRSFAGGTVYVPNGSSLTTLTPHVAPNPDATFEPAHDESGSAISITVSADQAHPLPTALFACGALKLVGNTTGTVVVGLKS
tara:strand:+ start:1322 stop:1642 length:321 start_codon:yes stop_codon:yes gene_type:complete